MYFVGLFLWNYVAIMGFKTSGDYLDQLWSNKILVLLWEGPNHSFLGVSWMTNNLDFHVLPSFSTSVLGILRKDDPESSV